jgi:hypothetical protein
MQSFYLLNNAAGASLSRNNEILIVCLWSWEFIQSPTRQKLKLGIAETVPNYDIIKKFGYYR